MAYDSKRERVVLFGVSTKTGAAPETWASDGSSWTKWPSPALVDTPNGAKMRREACPMARKRRSFTKGFKADAVRLAQAGDRSVGQVAKDLDLTETSLRAWVKQAEVDAGSGPEGTLRTAEREELTRLRRENKRLQMEREI